MRQREPPVLARVAIDVDRLAAAADDLDLLLEQPAKFHQPDIGGTQYFTRAVHDRALRRHDHDVLRDDVVADPVPVLVVGRYLEPRYFGLRGYAHVLRKAIGAMADVERVRIVDGDLIG